VYSCASITLPMLAQYALVRCKPRPPKKLYRQLPEMTRRLREKVDSNEQLQKLIQRVLPT
jgi:hypothetical protein